MFAGLAVFVALLISWLTPRIHDWTVGAIQRQPRRKKIKSALEGADRSVTSLVEELTRYKIALAALIAAYRAAPDNFSEHLIAFKAVSTKISLPRIDSAKVKSILPLTHIHADAPWYYDIYHNVDILAAFCNSYREFFAELNLNRMEPLNDMIESLHHSAATMKPNGDYLMQRTTRKDADQAIRYFEQFMMFADKSLETADTLGKELKAAIRQNDHSKVIAAILNA